MGSIKGQKHNPYIEGKYAHLNPNDVVFTPDWLAKQICGMFAIDEPQYLKPILRPLSDLNKVLFINGGFGFIPSKRIVNEYLHTSFWGENEIGMGVLDKERKMINLCFIGNEIVGECPYMIYQNLCEWHFDIFNLIGQGLAVDINTLSVQNDG